MSLIRYLQQTDEIMESIENTPVGRIAATDFRICDVFEKYGIDYFNQGKNISPIGSEKKIWTAAG